MKKKPSNRAKVIRLAACRREIESIERLAVPSGLRSLPWHAIFATALRKGTASPEIVKAAEASRREWEAYRERVPTAAETMTPQERRALAKKAAAARARWAKAKKKC
jgi:hypothetical protein